MLTCTRKTLIEFGTSQPISETQTELKILLDFAKIIESLSFLFGGGGKERYSDRENRLNTDTHTPNTIQLALLTLLPIC